MGLIQIEFSIADGTDCNVYDTNNAGCGVKINDNKSYGPEFNSNGGGWYVFDMKHWLLQNNRNQVRDRKELKLHQNFLLGEDEWLCSERRQVSWVKRQY